MSSRAPVCAWVAVCALALSSAAGAQERTAEDVVEAIVRDGPRAVAIRAAVEVVRREQDARLAFPNPGVVFSREGAGFTEFLQVEQPLPAFGLRSALRRAGVTATAAAEAERDTRLWDLRVEATRMVTEWLRAEARMEATAAETRVVEQLVEVLRTREREGEGSRFDRLRGEQEVAELRQVAVTLAVAVAEVRGLVAAMLPPSVTVTKVTGARAGPGAAPDVEALVTRARGARSDLLALQRGVERAALEADVARRERGFIPTLSGGLKRADNEGARERGGVLGLNVTLPLFDPGRRESARWTAEGARLTAERTALEQQVRAEVMRAAEMLTLRQQALRNAGADALASELVTTAEVAYREGDIGIGVLLDAMRSASRARMRDLDRMSDVHLAQVALERAVGERMRP